MTLIPISKKYGLPPLREVPAIARRHPQLHVGTAATAGGGGTAMYERRHDRDTAARAAGRAVVGAGVAQGAYQLAGVGAKQYNDRVVKPREEAASPLTRNKRKKIWDAHRKKHGLRGTGMVHGAADKWHQAFLNYPEELPGWKIERRLARTHGGASGIKTGAAVTGAGAVLGLAARRRKEPVHKADQYLRRGDAGFVPREGAVREPTSRSMFGGETHHATSGYTGNAFHSTGPNRFREMPHQFKGYERAAEAKVPHAGRVLRHLRTDEPTRAALLVGGGLTAAGLAVGHLAEKEQQKRRAIARQRRQAQRQVQPVGKSDLEVHDRRISPVRAAGALAGAGALTYGGSRLLGSSLTRGAKMASALNKPGLERALLRGEGLREATVRRTAGAGGIGRLPYVGPLANAVPKGARPLVAAGVGTELLRHSVPVHRDRYRPATASDVTGW